MPFFLYYSRYAIRIQFNVIRPKWLFGSNLKFAQACAKPFVNCYVVLTACIASALAMKNTL